MGSNTLKSDKRKLFQEIRNSISEEQMKLAAKKVAQSGFELINKIAKENTVISGYYPYGNELNPLPLMEHLAKSGFTITLPKITNDILIFYKWDFLEKSLVVNHSHPNIKEVRNNLHFLIPNIVLTPLISFDRELNRLGQGGGYYDRTIDMLPDDTIKIGLAYEQQLSKELLPINKYDRKLNYVITENSCH